MAIILDGKKLRDKILLEIKDKIDKSAIKPELAVVLVGDNPASQLYVRNKQRYCEIVGIKTRLIELPNDTPEQTVIDAIKDLNNNDNVTALLVQMPLPAHICANNVINAISPSKDVDCFTNENIGKMYSNNNPTIFPCTPCGVIKLLDEYNINLTGLNAVVIGRSNIAGRPMAQMLLNRNVTVTICHSYTKNLSDITKTADIVISAVGKTILYGRDIKPGAIVVSIGQYFDSDRKIHGDIDFESVKEVAGYITPITGGVGPMTIATLLLNTMDLFRQKTPKWVF